MIYVTSDLHGYPLDNFLRMLDRAGFTEEDTLYILGDVVDRNGDGGIAMLRWIMSRPNIKMILGNHEDMLLACSFLFDDLSDEDVEEMPDEQMRPLMRWMRNGCRPTMNSLMELKEREPKTLEKLFSYLQELPLYRKVNACGRDYLLVHSGLGNFSADKKMDEYEKDELIWHRPSQDEQYFQDVTTVFGHTPAGYLFGKAGRMFRTETWIDIDVGAAGGKPPMILRLEDLKEFYADEMD